MFVDCKEKINYTVTNSSEKTTFTSSNKNVATVNSSGTIVAKKAGTATITLKNSGVTAKVKVTVKNPYLNVTKKTLRVKKTLTLKVNGAVGKVTFKSSNKKIADVNVTTGKITAKKAGKAVITASFNKRTVKCKITVKK